MSYCFFDVQMGDQRLPRIVFELFDKTTPKTCDNFRKLCSGNNGAVVPGTSTPMSYKGSIFHRIIPEFMIQGGDFTNFDGTGGVSIYGEQFEDENFEMACDRPGLLCMANRGPNTNGSQFFVTCVPCHHLTGKHVVFGKVVRGMNSVRQLENTQIASGDKPVNKCVIVDCGTLEELPAIEAPKDGDVFPDFPADLEEQLDDAKKIEGAQGIRQIGNGYFSKGEFQQAIQKYEKAVRYLNTVTVTSALEKTIDDLKLACSSNTAMCYLKLRAWAQANVAASQALKIDNKNTKALFRRALAKMETNNFDEAQVDLRLALQQEPGNAEVAAKLEEAIQKEKARNEKLAAGYRKMFG
jgi:peptidyl-prolyl isomerase D